MPLNGFGNMSCRLFGVYYLLTVLSYALRPTGIIIT